MRERERKRERERERRAIHMLLIYSIFSLLLLFFCFLYFTYSIRILHSLQKNDIISSNAYRSVVRMTQVFDLGKCSISRPFLQDFNRVNDLVLCYNGFLIHLYLLDPSGIVITLAFLVWVSTPPW